MCQKSALFKQITNEERQYLKQRCGGSWKLVLKFLLAGEPCLRNGAVYTFGSNKSGRLGHGSPSANQVANFDHSWTDRVFCKKKGSSMHLEQLTRAARHRACWGPDWRGRTSDGWCWSQLNVKHLALQLVFDINSVSILYIENLLIRSMVAIWSILLFSRQFKIILIIKIKNKSYHKNTTIIWPACCDSGHDNNYKHLQKN